MNSIVRRARPLLESLEARECPTVSLRYLPQALILTGRPSGDLTITGLANGLFNVSDNGKSLGNYALNRNLIIQLSSRPGNLEIDLKGKTLGGNVLINLGNGYVGPADPTISVDVFDSTNSGASIRGTVTILRGNGRELIGLGGQTDKFGTFQTGAVTIRGNTTVVARLSGGTQDQLQAGAGTKILGNLTLVQVDAVSLGEQNVDGIRVARDVNITTTGGNAGTTVTMLGDFGGNVNVNGLASTPGFNAFTLQTQIPAGAGSTVAGSVNVTFGQALLGNIFQVLADPGNPFTSEIGGNLTFTSRNGLASVPLTDLYVMQGVVAGSFFINLGYGDSDVSFFTSTGGVDAEVFGNIVIRGSSGGVTNIGAGFNLFNGIIGGSLSIFLGNGTNTVDIQSAVPGRLTYRGGNGTDSLTLSPAMAATYLIDATFGTGTNTFELSDDVTLNGIVRGTGGNNTFIQNNATLAPTLIFLNFP